MNDKKRQQIIEMLQVSFNMEIETVVNYLSNSIYLDGIHAKHIRDSLAADVQQELLHAQQLARRIKVLEGRVPGSLELKMNQKTLQPPQDPLDVRKIIEGVIQAEESAIAQYQKIIEATESDDPVTNDLCIELKGDEEEHRREFAGFLREALRMKLS